VPNLLKEYDVVGFDTEHTLVKFNNHELTRLLISTHLKSLHENHGYNKEIMNFDYESNLDLCLNNAVWDIQNGLVLKLSSKKEILHGMRGFEKVSDAELYEIYGEPPIFDMLKWPQTNCAVETEEGAH
jgi:hypothetical protein